MKELSKKKEPISRRHVIPIIGSSLLIPFFGFGNSKESKTTATGTEEYQKLLKPDGTMVKVKVSAVKQSKILKKNLSNKTFFNWLGRKH